MRAVIRFPVRDFLDEAELPNIKDIFWRNNIVGFAPMLGGEASVEGEPVRILGTFFSQPVDIPDEEGYETGRKRSAHTGR